MTALDSMSPDEQKQWWLEQAKAALTPLNLADAKLNWLAYTHNAVFALQHGAEQTILRLQTPNTRPRLVAEEHILAFLHERGLPVPQPLQRYETDNVIGLHLSYLAGRTRNATDITTDEMTAIGAFLAQLHQMPYPVDDNEERPRLDWQGLFGADGTYDPGEENVQIFTTEHHEAMSAVAEQVREAMDELGKGTDEYGLIHGDFLLHNILFHEGQVRALDFEYCGWGYYLYDLTPVLWQLKPQPHYADLEAALWQGYTAIRPLAQRHRDLLETIIAGRQVASMRWLAANQHNPAYAGRVGNILDQRAAELRGFLDTGALNRS